MHIKHIEIGNFRKLLAVRIDFSEETTVFVGANNSGKTSAMTSLQKFLVRSKSFSTHDFTLSHWKEMDRIGAEWEKLQAANEKLPDFDWSAFLPFLDVWLAVEKNELHRVQQILPTLDWESGPIGVRLSFGPKDAKARETFQHAYLKARSEAAAILAQPGAVINQTDESGDEKQTAKPFSLWPHSMMAFLERKLHSVFSVNAYLLDPKQLKEPENGLARPQHLPPTSEALDGDPFKGIIRIDYIDAQRGFSDGGTAVRGNGQDGDVEDSNAGKKLSMQLRSYYAKHLDLLDRPEPQDIQALQALHAAEATFDHRLKQSFAKPLKELELIGYPGVTDPKLTITTRIKPIDGLNHGAAVQYEVPSSQIGAEFSHCLPEDSNGLGYQNLMSMIFKLMRYRDEWRQVGKAALSWTEKDELPPPLHLVLIEEPEAHLHAQVQQVFIRQAYKVLRNHDELGESKSQTTQMVVSTHSSHLAHEADFASLRYFRRLPALEEFGTLPVASVVNLSNIFGENGKTNQFVKRYLKATHCDLFFADGAILIEGPAERILIPHLVRERKEYEYLQSAYITWLEIGGSHAHRLRPLLDQLGMTTLIITDIDAKAEKSEKAMSPKRNAKLRARNETLKTWIPKEESLDTLLDMSHDKKAIEGTYGYAVRVAYQSPISMAFKAKKAKEALANTFEDALLYTNPEFFAALEGNGLITKFKTALAEAANINALAKKVHEALKDAKKAEFAMDLMLSEHIDKLQVPQYIDEGLLWLVERLKRKEEDVVGKNKVAP